MIANTVRTQVGGTSHDALLYSKPYTNRIDILWMFTRYQPLKFMQFDGKGNPKQHVVQFVETCTTLGLNETTSQSSLSAL
ncbi:hypothetical protein ACFX15_046447 [Malus domestica]